jgi:mannose-1-phosphate guanylyltransferase
LKEIRALLLAAGKGVRLKPLTDEWPKCLMPIGKRPLLEYWLQTLYQAGINMVVINLHYHADQVESFLQNPCFRDWVNSVHEEALLGTAGTLLANKSYFQDCTTLLVHADNWCQCDFPVFLEFHQNSRPVHCPITMMTFTSPTPKTCGIVETDQDGVVQDFHEKVENPPSDQANGAVYLLEPEVMQWLENHPSVRDFSTEVIPHFIGRIVTWHNSRTHRDIGEISMLRLAQSDPKPAPLWEETDDWHQAFLQHPVHQQITSTLN